MSLRLSSTLSWGSSPARKGDSPACERPPPEATQHPAGTFGAYVTASS